MTVILKVYIGMCRYLPLALLSSPWRKAGFHNRGAGGRLTEALSRRVWANGGGGVDPHSCCDALCHSLADEPPQVSHRVPVWDSHCVLSLRRGWWCWQLCLSGKGSFWTQPLALQGQARLPSQPVCTQITLCSLWPTNHHRPRLHVASLLPWANRGRLACPPLSVPSLSLGRGAPPLVGVGWSCSQSTRAEAEAASRCSGDLIVGSGNTCDPGPSWASSPLSFILSLSSYHTGWTLNHGINVV